MGFVLIIASACGHGAGVDRVQGEGQELTLAADGQARARVALPAVPTEQERTAARELAGYLSRITGATFEVVAETAMAPDEPGIFVGNTELARAAGAVPAEEEAWVVRTQGNRLILAGGEPNGTFYAVYHFLEDECGVRWWNRWEEEVPQRPTLAVPALERTGKPDMVFRWLHDCTPQDRTTPPLNLLRNRWQYHPPVWWRGGSRADWEPWGRIGIVDSVLSGHGMYKMMGFPYIYSRLSEAEKQKFKTDVFDKHPDWFAFAEGKRQIDSNPCLSNPEVFEKMAAFMEARIEANEKLYGDSKLKPLWYDASVLDAPKYATCTCPECAKLNTQYGSYSGTVIWFLNKLAERVRAKHPHVSITSYMNYGGTADAPRNIQAKPGVILYLVLLNWDVTTPFDDPKHNMAGRDQAWFDAIGDGNFVFYWYHLFNPMPYTHPEYVARGLRFLHKKGCVGGRMQDDVAISDAFDDPILWVTIKLMEDLDQDADRLLGEFCRGYYGEAAGAKVKQVWDLLLEALDRNRGKTEPLAHGPAMELAHMDLEFLDGVSRLFDEAEKACAGDAARLLRVQYARMPYDYAILYNWAKLVRQQRDPAYAGGRYAGGLPFDRKVVGERAIQTYETMLDRRVKNGPLKIYPPSGLGEYNTYASADYIRQEVTDDLKREGQKVLFEGFEAAVAEERPQVAEPVPSETVPPVPAAKPEHRPLTIPGWQNWSRAPLVHDIAEGPGYRSARSLVITKAVGTRWDHAILARSLPVKAGESYLVEAFCKQDGKGAPRLSVLWENAAGGLNHGAGQSHAEFLEYVDERGEPDSSGWKRARLLVTVPDGDVKGMRVIFFVHEQDEASAASLDDVAVYRLAP